MIKLIITSDSSPPITRCFEHSPISIGGPSSGNADLKLADSSLLDMHVQILSTKEQGKTVFFALNLANDPFATLNGLPFGKQPIGNNDLIHIGDVAIRFEIDSPTDIPESKDQSPANDSSEKNQTETQSTEIQSAIPRQKDSINTSRISDNPETVGLKLPILPSLSQNERTLFDSPLSQGTKLAYPNPSTPAPQTPNTGSPTPPPPIVRPSKLSLKDYYLSEYDDEGEATDNRHESKAKGFIAAQITKRWRVLVAVMSSLIFVTIVTAGFTFLWVSDQSGEEEIMASRAIVDVAMALTYAQLKHIHPQNQNWSYPEFIKNNLHTIMAPDYSPLAEFDAHGQFTNCPYMLRIHTSSDSSQFLVIAQPAPSLLHWLIPKASIVIDSRTMEMRKITDLKALNRLIVNSNSLDGASADEITNLVKQGKLIPLADLVDKNQNQGFIPPKALGLIRPGAENLIYNAPRYYLLGETVLNTALGIVDSFGGAGEVNMLQQELNSLMKYPDLVLYSSEGIQNALQAQKALSTIAPKDKFLIAYLQMSSKGQISSTHLLMDDTSFDVAVADNFEMAGGTMTMDDYVLGEKAPLVSSFPLEPENINRDRTHQNDNKIDHDDPLLLQLTALSHTRQWALTTVSNEIIDLVKAQSHAAQNDFYTRFAALQQRFMEANHDQQLKIAKKIEEFLKEQKSLPATRFMDYIKAANLEVSFREYLSELKLQHRGGQVSDDQIDQEIRSVTKSENWRELEGAVAKINQLLRFENIPNEERLVSFQNSARLLVTQKLNQFILSSDSSPSTKEFSPDYLQALSNILADAWIDDAETHDFYIEEFELREPHH